MFIENTSTIPLIKIDWQGQIEHSLILPFNLLTPVRGAISREQLPGCQDQIVSEAFQPLMGEPSLWNMSLRLRPRLRLRCFNPSWESRPSGTWHCSDPRSGSYLVSTPHGRAVPLELTDPDGKNVWHDLFQPLMGEPSLWNMIVECLKCL